MKERKLVWDWNHSWSDTSTFTCSYPWCSRHQCLSESQIKRQGWTRYHCNTFFLASLKGGNSHPRVSGNGTWAVGLGNQDFGCFFLACQRLTSFCLSPHLPWITDKIMLPIILSFSWLLFHLSMSWPPQLNLAALAINHSQSLKQGPTQSSTLICENRSIMILTADFLTSLSLSPLAN